MSSEDVMIFEAKSSEQEYMGVPPPSPPCWEEENIAFSSKRRPTRTLVIEK